MIDVYLTFLAYGCTDIICMGRTIDYFHAGGPALFPY